MRILAMSIVVSVLGACSSLPDAPRARSMTTGEPTPPPFGYVDFCDRHKSVCDITPEGKTRPRLSAKRWAQLQSINMEVNTLIDPVTDLDLYGVVEYWTYPGTRGDCEDYVLEKRRRLIGEGWPESALLISVALESTGAAHAVLIVATDRGDFVLDNKVADILPWDQTPYVWDKRQSETDPLLWLTLNTPSQNDDVPSASLAQP